MLYSRMGKPQQMAAALTASLRQQQPRQAAIIIASVSSAPLHLPRRRRLDACCCRFMGNTPTSIRWFCAAAPRDPSSSGGIDISSKEATLASKKPPPDSLGAAGAAVAVDFEELLTDLKQVESLSQQQQQQQQTELAEKPLHMVVEDAEWSRTVTEKYERALELLCQQQEETVDQQQLNSADELTRTRRELLSAETVGSAILAVTSCGYEPTELSKKMRQLEKSLGKLKQTPLIDSLSARLLMAHGLAGNVGRVQSLLQLRKARGYTPRETEFIYAVRSLSVAGLANHVNGVRNIFIHDDNQSAVENPTRWLDAILLNMSERNFPLTTPLANRMIHCYSVTGGRTFKATHFFYKVVRQGILAMPPEDRPLYTDEMPNDWSYVPETGQYVYQPVKVKVKYYESSPPFYKVPAVSKDKFFYERNSTVGKLKLDREVDPEYSLPLAAAFSFADSLQHGACGHDPITLDVGSYNALMKACVVRGALWRAMHVLNSSMPAAGIEPNTKSYNLLLSGLASVGDVTTAQEYYLKMNKAGIHPDEYTVSAIVGGLLNNTDVPGAITVVQDFFHQHHVLPRIWTHSKILELSLGQGMVYEAKRYVRFIQLQLLKWEPDDEYHQQRNNNNSDNNDFVELMRRTQQSPSLQRDALKKMFAYFGEKLKDSDFLP